MSEQEPKKIRRLIAHFPGFEPFDAEALRKRYLRSAENSCSAFNFKAKVGPLNTNEFAANYEIVGTGPNWETSTKFYVFEHIDLLIDLTRAPIFKRVWRGYRAACGVLAEGGLKRYFKTSWRFALFFLYPFVLMALGTLLAALAAAAPSLLGLPLLFFWLSLPFSVATFVFGFLPLAKKIYMLHTMALWELAVKVARLDDPAVVNVIERHILGLQAFFNQDADEYVITTFSLGGAFMTHAFGLLLQRTPELITGKSVKIVTLGGPGLQCSLLKCAETMRNRIRAILAQNDVFWLDVQCKYDVVSFYSGRVARDNKLTGMREPVIKTIRLREILTPENYASIKWDAMRVHRQFVYGSDKRSHYDFTLLTVGPFSVEDFAGFNWNNLPPLGPDGAILS